MQPKKQLEFESVDAFQNAHNRDHLIIWGKQKNKSNSMILADYYRDKKSLVAQFILKSVLTKKQLNKVVLLIKKYHPDAEVKL